MKLKGLKVIKHKQDDTEMLDDILSDDFGGGYVVGDKVIVCEEDIADDIEEFLKEL